MFEKDIFTKLTPLLPSTSGFTDQNPRDKYQALLTLRGLLGSNIYSRRYVDALKGIMIIFHNIFQSLLYLKNDLGLIELWKIAFINL